MAKPHLSPQTRFQMDWYRDHDEQDLPTDGYRGVVLRKHFRQLIDLINVQTGLHLEVGCGAGAHTREFARAWGVRSVVACDLSARRVAIMKRDLPRVKAVVADSHHLPFRTSRFNTVYGFGILHHVDDMPAALAEVVRVARDGAQIGFGEELNAYCPFTYLLAVVYRNWQVERGFVRIRPGYLKPLLASLNVTDVRYTVSGMTICGMGKTVYRFTSHLDLAVHRASQRLQ